MTIYSEFEAAFNAVIDHEKGFQNNPKDRGNWTTGVIGKGICKGTKYGISAMSYPDLDIKNITLQMAKDIYYRDYWLSIKADQLPSTIRFDMFDTAVNSSKATAVRLLQRAVKVTVDGVIGPASLRAINAMNPEQLDSAFNGYRLLFVADAKAWTDYGRGWVIRIANNLIKD